MSKAMFSHAEAYQRFMGRWSERLAPEFVRFCDVREGDQVLDVGCGTGVLSRAVHAAAPTANVLGVDPTPEFLESAARYADDHLRFERGRAEQLPCADASFDKVLSSLVLNFVPDRPAALAEMKRATRAGGLIAACVWDYGGMEMLDVFWQEAAALDPKAAARDEALMPLCKRGELATFWREQRLTAVEDTALDITLEFASFDDYWAPFLLGQGPAGMYAAQLSQAASAALRDRLRARLERGTEPIRMSARAWAVKGQSTQ